MFDSLKNMFSPFSAISPYSYLSPLSNELELGKELRTDIHSHILPGIDDGAYNIDESITMIEKLIQLGYDKIITTPHMIQDRYSNSHEKISNALILLRQELSKRLIDIEVEAAAEYYLDEQFEKLLYSKELLTFSDNYILFEISSINQPKNLFDLILEMQLAGYKPVIAHPERYSFMHNNREIYKSLKEKGVLFQLDLLSFTTYHSFDVQKTALWLCSNSMIDFAGSDAHKIKDLEIIEKLKSTSILKTLYTKNKLLNNIL